MFSSLVSIDLCEEIFDADDVDISFNGAATAHHGVHKCEAIDIFTHISVISFRIFVNINRFVRGNV